MKAKLTKVQLDLKKPKTPRAKAETIVRTQRSQGPFWIYREVIPKPGEKIYDNLCEYKLVTYPTYIKIRNSMSRNRRGHWQIYSHPVK